MFAAPTSQNIPCRDGNVPVPKKETVNHPAHYGGKDNPFEHVKVARALGWVGNAFIYNCTKYLWRLGIKDGASRLEDLKKAVWYLNEAIRTEEEKVQ